MTFKRFLSLVTAMIMALSSMPLTAFASETPDVEVEVHTHDYVLSAETAPGCTDSGSLTYTCSCGDSYTEVIGAYGHSYSETVVDATCTADGSRVSTCSSCGDNVTEVIPAAGHNYEENVVESTCTVEGSKTQTCTVCGDIITETLPVADHSYEETVVEATCTVEGSKTLTCTACGDIITEILPVADHSYEETVVESTCTTEGSKTLTCTACGDVVEEVLPVADHNFEEDTENSIEATCTEEGSLVKVCSVCGEIETEVVEMAEHDYVDGFCSVCSAPDLAVMAKEASVAQIGDVGYATLAEAFANANNEDTIILVGDIYQEAQAEVPAGKKVVLDLNGFSITSAYQEGSSTKHIYPISNYGDLTITGNGSITGRGIYNQDGAKITVNGAKIVAEDWNGGACIWSYGSGEVYLNNAELIGYTGVVSSEGYLEINGGTYTCYSGIEDSGAMNTPTYNIRAYNGLKITDGTFTSRHGVISVGGGEAVIEGGSYTIQFAAATTSNVVYVYSDADVTIEDGSFISDNSAQKADSGAAVLVSGENAKMTINGGTYVGMNGMVSGNSNTVINAGSFSTVWDYNDYGKIEPYVTAGKTITVNGEQFTKQKEITGSVTPGYTSQTAVWGEGGGNASESLVVELYVGEQKIATASLNNVDGIIDGDVYVTWSMPFAGSTDEYWTVEWAEGHPNANEQPTKVVMIIDGVKVAENDVQMNAPDNLNPVVWNELEALQPDVARILDANGNVLGTYKNFESAIAAAVADANVTRLEVLCDYTQAALQNPGEMYVLAAGQNLTIGAPAGESYTITVTRNGESFSIYQMENNTSLTIASNVALEGLDIIANGFATSGNATTIDGSVKALSLKQWTSNNEIVVSETGSVWLGYGDGQFDLANGNGSVTVNGTLTSTADLTGVTAQFKAGYSGTRGDGGNTLNLNDTYFEAGAWFNLKGSNGTINVDNSVLMVSGGDSAGKLDVASTGNNIVLSNGSRLVVDNITLAADNKITLDSTSKVEAAKITGAGAIVIDATGMNDGDVVAVTGDLSGFTGTYEVINNNALEASLVDGQIVLTEKKLIEVTYADDTVELFADMLDAVPFTTNYPKLEGATVKLLGDIEAPGIRMMENDMVLDLNGFTYTITEATGSKDTKTSGFQIRGEVTTEATIKNGTIKVAEGVPVVWMFNVYATDFVVEDVTVDCANMAYSYGESCYVSVSRAGDNVQFLGNTKFVNFNAAVAGNAVNVGDTMTIADTVDVGGTIELDSGAKLTAPAGLNVVAAADGYVVSYQNGVYSAALPVAQIGEKKFASLADAAAAAQDGDTITMLADVEFDTSIENTKTITIDLNGKSITGKPSTPAAYAVISNKGNLTINDSVGGGGIYCDHQLAGSTSYAVNTITNSGVLTINNGTIENKSTASNQIGYAIDNNSTVGNAVITIIGGEVKASGSNYYDGIRLFANSTTLENSVTVKGGSVSSIWMQNPSDGSSDRNTKDVKGSISITGGSVNALYTEPSSAFSASITGGHVGSVAYFETSEGRDLTGFISGGTFTTKPDDCMAIDGHFFSPNDEGKYEVKEIPELPTATVTELEKEDLTFALNFKADDATEDQLEYYGDWYADFVLTVSKDATFNADETADGWLSGQYDAWSAEWVNVPFENVTMKAGESLKIMEYAAELLGQSGLKLTYNDVYSFVKDFDCGVFFTNEYLTNNQDLVVTLELRMYNPADESESYVIGETYTFQPKVYVAQIGEKKFASLADAAAAAQDGDTIVVIADHEISSSDVLSLDGKYNTFVCVAGKEVTIDLNGKKITSTYDGTDMLVGVFSVEDNGKLTLKDSVGTAELNVTAVSTVYSLLVCYDNTSALIVEDGSYILDKASDSLIYTGGNENVTIKDGIFQLDNVGTGKNGSPWIFNALGQNTSHVMVSGGTYNADIHHQYYPFEVEIPKEKALKSNDDGTWTVVDAVAYVNEQEMSGRWYTNNVGYATLAEAIASANQANNTDAVVSTVTLLKDVEIDQMLSITGKNVALDLNGKTITGTDSNASGNFYLINNTGKLTVKDSSEAQTGKIALTAVNNRNFGSSSVVIANNPNGVLTVESGTIEHLGGTDMAYALDNLTNSGIGDAIMTVNGGTIKSSYIAIRQFLNCDKKDNKLTINGGTITSTSGKALFFQTPNDNVDNGTLLVNDGAIVEGTVYLYGNAVDWNVDVKLSQNVVKESDISAVDFPIQYAVKLVDGYYTVVELDPVAKIGDELFYSLQAAIDACTAGDNTITLLADLDEDVTIKQVEGVNVTIDGAEKVYSGTITIHGNARYTGAETLTIKNVKFETAEASHYFIDSNSTGSVERYAHNVTVQDCTFTATAEDNSVVGLRIRQGFDITVKDCTSEGLHTVMWTTGTNTVNVSGVKAEGKSAFSFGTSFGITVENSEFDCDEFGIRADGSDAYDLTVENCTISADMPIVIRKNTGAYELTVNGSNTLTAGNEGGYQVIFTNGDDGEYVVPTGAYVYTTDDANAELVVFPDAAYVAQIGDVKYLTLADAITAAQPNDTIEFLADITEDVTVTKNISIDGADFNYTGTMTLNKVNLTIENVNFVKGTIYKNKSTGIGGTYTIKNCTFDGQNLNTYAVNLGGTGSIVIENVTAKGYGYGFLQVPASNTSVSVKDVEISDVNYGFKIDYSNGVTIENAKVDAAVAGLLNSNYGEKTITIKNSELSIYGTWTRNNTTKTTVVFEGANTVGEFIHDANVDTLKLADVDSTLTAAEGLIVITDVDEHKVVYEEGVYKVVPKVYVAEVTNNGVTTKYESLQAAIDACTAGDNTITMLVDLDEDVIIKQVEGVNVTIDGAENVYSGTITIYGNARYTGAETLTIKNVKFETAEASHYFIDSNSTGSVERYAHNVTVEDCSFTATGDAVNTAVAMRIRQGFDIAVVNSTADSMHSVVQAYGNAGLTVDGLTVTNGKNGISAGTSTSVVVKNSTIEAEGYGIRADGSGAYDLTVENCTISADMPIVVRKNTGAYELTVNGSNTLTAGNEGGYQVIFTNGDDGTYEEPTGAYQYTTDDANGELIVYPDSAYVAAIGDEKYFTLADAITAVQDGETIVLLVNNSETVTIKQAANKSFTIDGDGKTFTGTININGNKRSTGAETLTIQNVNFVAEGEWQSSIFAVKSSYVHNVTIDGCTFTGNDEHQAYGIRLHHAYNITVKNTTGSKLYDLVYAQTAVTGFVAENVEVTESGMGLMLPYGKNLSFTNVTLDVSGAGFGIYNYNSSTATFEDCTITGAPAIWLEQKNATNTYTLIFNGTNELGGEGQIKVVGSDAMLKAVVNDTGIVDEDFTGMVAKIGNVYYNTLANALKEAEAGDTVELVTDVELTEALILGEDITLSLNGNQLTGNVVGKLAMTGGTYITAEGYNMVAPLGTEGFYYLTDDGVFVIEANGDITIAEGEVELGQSWRTLEGQTLTVADGASFTVPADMTLELNSTAIVEENGELIVDGTIELMIMDATLTAVEGLNVITNIADHKVVYEDGVYKVAEKVYVAQIGETKYETLADAIAAAEAEDTIELLKDVELDEILVIEKAVTLDLSEMTIIGAEGSIAIQIAADVTITNGSVKGYVKGNSNGVIKVMSGHLELTDVELVADIDVNSPRALRVQSTGSATLTDCTVTGYVSALGQTDIMSGTYYNCDGSDYNVLDGVGLSVYGGTFHYIVEESDCAQYLMPKDNGDGTWTVEEMPDVAQVNGTNYKSVAEALAAANDGDTVTLLMDYTGEGLVIDKAITLDLAGYTYTLETSVGSAGTETNGLQILESAGDVTIKNGTLAMAEDKDGDKYTLFTMIQNYTDLTLDGVTLDCTNGVVPENGNFIALNTSNGEVVIKGGSSIINSNTDGYVAINAWDNSAYAAGSSVVVEEDADLIEGQIVVDETLPAEVTLYGGTYTYDVTELCAEGYIADDNGNGTWTVVEDKLFDIVSSNIVLGNELAMYFYVMKSDLEGEDYVAVITKTYADGRSDLVVQIPYEDWENTTNERMRFRFDGIAAKEMGDNINVVIKVASTMDDASNPYNDCIKAYVERGFNNGKVTNKELGTLLVDMLNYGAAAQRMFNYNVTELANSNMDAYQEEYATKSVTCTNNQVKGDGYRSATLTLESRLIFTMLFNKTHVTQDMTAVVTFTDHYGASHELKISGADFEDRGAAWGIEISEHVVADACQILTCTFLDANGNIVEGVSGQDSIESLCARAIAGGGGDYYEYIMKFSIAAYNYFH